jgi:hypothetical protein
MESLAHIRSALLLTAVEPLDISQIILLLDVEIQAEELPKLLVSNEMKS